MMAPMAVISKVNLRNKASLTFFSILMPTKRPKKNVQIM